MKSVVRPGLLADAVPGNHRANAEALNHAAAFLEAGAPMPPELAAWLATRLKALAEVLRDDRDPKKHGALGALQVSRRKAPGRAPESAQDKALKRSLVLEVAQERQFAGAKRSDIFRLVADRRNRDLQRLADAGVARPDRVAEMTVTEDLVKHAWKHRKRYAPEIPE